jgi:DNA-directed RNA polymerase subunit RPC12/RpoP
MGYAGRYRATGIIIRILQVFAALGLPVAVGSIILTISGEPLGPVILLSCLLSALILFASAEGLEMVRDTAINSFRTADAVERLLAAPVQAVPPTRPPTPPPANIPVEPAPPAMTHVSVCGMCGAKIKLPSDGRVKPGDRIRCPKCKALTTA